MFLGVLKIARGGGLAEAPETQINFLRVVVLEQIILTSKGNTGATTGLGGEIVITGIGGGIAITGLGGEIAITTMLESTVAAALLIV